MNARGDDKTLQLSLNRLRPDNQFFLAAAHRLRRGDEQDRVAGVIKSNTATMTLDISANAICGVRMDSQAFVRD